MAEQSFEPESRPWEPLKQAFLSRVLDSNSPAPTNQLWRLFAADRWFQQLLDRRARRALAVRRMGLDWLGDVKHEALLSLDRQLAKTPDLHVDLARVDATFPAWLGVIVDRACGEALHWLTQLDRFHRAMFETLADPRQQQSCDAMIDMVLAFDEQDEPERTMLHLKADGYSIQEIAEQLKMTYWEVYRRLRAAMARVQRRLAPYRHENRERTPPALPASSSSTMTR